MKRLLKLAVLSIALAAVVAAVVRVRRRSARGRLPEELWSPPIVAAPEAEPPVDVPAPEADEAADLPEATEEVVPEAAVVAEEAAPVAVVVADEAAPVAIVVAEEAAPEAPPERVADAEPGPELLASGGEASLAEIPEERAFDAGVGTIEETGAEGSAETPVIAAEDNVLTDAFERLANTEDEPVEETAAAGFATIEPEETVEGEAEAPEVAGPEASTTPTADPDDIEAEAPPLPPVEERPDGDVAVPAAATEGALSGALERALTEASPPPVTSASGRDAESYLDEGNVYFNVGQYNLAIDRYTRALENDPGLTAGYYNRANARTRTGEYEHALADYDEALKLQPEDADALNNRGMLHLYRANYAAALVDFNAALAGDPNDTTVMVNRGLANLHSGDAASALVDFQEAAAMDQDDAAAHYGAAQAASVLGNREEALRRMRRALHLDAGYAREAAADAKLANLHGDNEFMRLLREASGKR